MRTTEGVWDHCQAQEVPVWHGTMCLFGAHSGRREGADGDIEGQGCQGNASPKNEERRTGIPGLTGYYRKFIPNYASIATSLTVLTRKSEPNSVKWTGDCEFVFQRLKDLLSSAPVLRAPDFTKTFIVQTDASDRGVGAVLSQRYEEDDQPVAFFSRKLLPRQERYSLWKRSALPLSLLCKPSEYTSWVDHLRSRSTTGPWSGWTESRRITDGSFIGASPYSRTSSQ